MKPWSTIFRNRGGGVCTLCCCLVFYVAVIVGTWAGLCIARRDLRPLPDGFVPGLVALSGFQAWKYRADSDAPPAGSPPA